ncbi:MAG: hypothetical protein JRN15_00840 [Nitrososphaerota archaeon]|nr:hypothetical protein [Nitrososphaerota archaeon]
MGNNETIRWLLEEDQPSMRYLALTELLGMSDKDSKVKSAKKNIAKKGWAKEILEIQTPSETWVNKARIWQPKYDSPFWRLLVLSDLGLTREEPTIDRACKVWIKLFATKDGGFSAFSKKEGHLCITGNMARALVKFGYEDHPKVKGAFQWLVNNESDKGGWSCWNFGGHRGGRNLDSWEPLSAFAVYPRQKWTRKMKLAVERGAEFFLERELHKQGTRYEPWYRFHYPHHYYYDLLVGLDFMTALGYSSDWRLGYALSLLKEKRRSDGRWNLDATNPDPESPQGKWDRDHPKQASIQLALEKPGKPSKMITLTALKVLKRAGEVSFQ